VSGTAVKPEPVVARRIARRLAPAISRYLICFCRECYHRNMIRMPVQLRSPRYRAACLPETFRTTWEAEHPAGAITHRDRGLSPVPPLLEIGAHAGWAFEVQHTPEQAEAWRARRELVGEVLAADAYLFSMPMYNWGVLGSFKTWIAQIIIPGHTVRFVKGTLTLSEVVPSTSELIPLFEQQRTAAHAAAETSARSLAVKFAGWPPPGDDQSATE
jgi:hypothetical protein